MSSCEILVAAGKMKSQAQVAKVSLLKRWKGKKSEVELQLLNVGKSWLTRCVYLMRMPPRRFLSEVS